MSHGSMVEATGLRAGRLGGCNMFNWGSCVHLLGNHTSSSSTACPGIQRFRLLVAVSHLGTCRRYFRVAPWNAIRSARQKCQRMAFLDLPCARKRYRAGHFSQSIALFPFDARWSWHPASRIPLLLRRLDIGGSIEPYDADLSSPVATSATGLSIKLRHYPEIRGRGPRKVTAIWPEMHPEKAYIRRRGELGCRL